MLLSLLVGTVLALLLDREFFGRGIARTLLITPFLIMPVVAGLLWKNQIFSSFLRRPQPVIEAFGFDAIPFVERFPFWAIVIVLVWQWSPFMMLIILAGLQSQPTDILEAARVDRASKSGHLHARSPCPCCGRTWSWASCSGAIYLLQVFDQIEVMTGGGPGSTNVPYFVYQRSIGGGWNFGQAAAYSIIVVIASIIIATFALRVLSSLFQRAGAGMTLTANDTQAARTSLAGARPRSASSPGSWPLVMFFPVFWMVLNSFKTELVANASPMLFFEPTLDRWQAVVESVPGLLSFNEAFYNSFVIVIVSTVLVMVLAIPAAYALSIYPVKAWRDVLFFFISTKFLPVVAAILPLWIIAKELDLLNTKQVLIILYTAMNLPLAVWMLRSFFGEVPRELIEAAQMDGTGLYGQLKDVMLPIVAPGIAATALLCFIFAWNEFFLAVQLNPVDNSTVPSGSARTSRHAGNFMAQLSAASTLAVLPVVHRRLGRPEADDPRPIHGSHQVGKPWLKSVYREATRIYPGHRECPRWTASTSPSTDGEFLVLVGPIRLRQVDGAAHARGARGLRRGFDLDRRSRRHPGPAQGPRRGHGLPELRALPAHDRGPEHRLPAQAAEGAQGRAREAGARGGAHPRPRAITSIASPRTSPVVSASAWPWAAPSCATRRSSSWTSRSPTSTPSCVSRRAPSWPTCRRGSA